jgi:type IV fimbrial biogenesis protein FimT
VDTPARGFTLIELLVTIAVMGVVLGFGVPGFQSVVNGNRLAAAANEAIANLQTARMEAIRRGRRVVICSSGNANAGAGATCATDDIDGWITFVDNDRSNAFSAGDTLLRNTTLDGTLEIGGVATVVYRSDGLARDVAGNLLNGAVRIAIDTTRPLRNVRCVGIRTSSGVAVQVPDANDGECS